jgi:hypothetical protein
VNNKLLEEQVIPGGYLRFLFIQIFLFNMLRIYVVNHPNGIQYSMCGEGISKIRKKKNLAFKSTLIKVNTKCTVL